MPLPLRQVAGTLSAPPPRSPPAPSHTNPAPGHSPTELLDWMHNKPEFNQTFGPFLDAQPAPGETLTVEVWPEDLIAELQTPALEALVRSHSKLSRRVYDGSYRLRKYAPFNATVPPSALPPHMFLHWVRA